MIIRKKIDSEYFDEIVRGNKKFEVRLDDFKISEGDNLVLEEVNDKGDYTGRKIEKKVGYILKIEEMSKFYSKENIDKFGLKVISLLD